MLKALAIKALPPTIIVFVVLSGSFLATPLASSKLPACGYGYVGYGVTSAPTVTNVTPNGGSTAGGTKVTITGSGFCTATAVDFGSTAASSFVIISDTEMQAVTPAEAAGTVDVTVTNAFGTSATSPADHFTFVVTQSTAKCITTQPKLTGSNGSTWVDMSAGLSATFTAGATGYAILGGNADLWTANTGFNQDMGIAVTGAGFPTSAGQPEAWKESGGFAGTFSPNAAFVQTVIPVTGGQAYTARLVWKANKADSGSIYAGAGPIGGRFSETCVNFRLVTSLPSVVAKSSTTQYQLINSNGSAWQDMATTNLGLTFTPSAAGVILVSGNSDLWTSTKGFNQDIGISISGGGYPTTAGQPETWKESGGFGGTFSPNAAFVQGSFGVASGTTYTVKLQWKANKAGTDTIYAGAGPINANFSPTKLTLLFLPANSAAIEKVSTSQYTLTSSNGSTWQAVDTFTFTLSYTPVNDCEVILGGNVDLFTGNAGFNQDIGITVNDTSFPSSAGQPEGWKESGGFAGTFSPNAAYVQITTQLSGGHTYTFNLVWKTNKPASGATIYAGAGPIAGKFSPTRLSLQPVGC